MAQENEYNRKESIVEEVTEKATPKKEKKTPILKNPIKDISARFDKKKAKSIVGAILILLSFYFFLACLSYIFTWTTDQDRVLDKSLIDFLFEDNEEPVANWLGKLGAWSSHLFIYRWFGLSSFGICVILFITGVRILLNVILLPIKKTYAVTSLMMVWSSLFLGFFASKVNY